MASNESLAAALATFYGKVGTIHEDAKAQYGSYADLSSVLSVVNPALAASGLAVTQTFEDDSEGRFLITTLHHTSGQTISSKTKLVTEGGRGNPLHTWGGSVTYQRRYALLAMLNLSAGIEDTDGDTASTAPVPAKQQPPQKAAAKPKPTPAPTPAPAPAPEPVSDADGPLAPELRQELLDTIPALPADYIESFCKAFAVQFKTGQQKISQCFTHYKHYTWTQDYFTKNPVKT